MIGGHSATNQKIKAVLENLSSEAFRDLGLEEVAYIRNNQGTYSLHYANGKEIANMKTHDQAMNETRDNDLKPVTLH